MAYDAQKFYSQVQTWLNDDYGRFARWRRAAAGVFYNRVPRRLRLIPAAHWICRNGLVASGPIVVLYYGTISEATALVAAAGLFLASSVADLLGLVSDKKLDDTSQTEALVRFGDLLSCFKSKAVLKDSRDEAIGACLGILEVHARLITKTSKGEISVSLVQYIGSSSTQMTIRHRNPGNLRPRGREFDGSSLLGHHACCAGAMPRVVHNLGHFGRNLHSPTQSSVDYKSMLFIPLETRAASGDARAKGFVSIDCQRPYAFYGNRSREIVVTCTPIVDHIKDLLTGAR